MKKVLLKKEAPFFNAESVFKLVSSVGLCFAVAAVGSLFTLPAPGSWYAALAKPAFSPPNSVFGPVWTVLYLLIGIALFLVWRKEVQHPGEVRVAALFFVFQMALNLSWSIVFFGLQSVFGGLAVIVLLWTAILATTALFMRISRKAAWLMVPYIAWVTFAMILNYAIWALN